MKFHTLAWPDVDKRITAAHQSVTQHLGVEVQYTFEAVDHGRWMNNAMMNSPDEIIGFMDIDCVPTNRGVVLKASSYVEWTQSLVGLAQVSNHIAPAIHVFAAPAFFIIHRATWIRLGMPTFEASAGADVAESVSYAAEGKALRYRVLYPTHYERAPHEGAWHLGNYGSYGIGTVFHGGVYHLYQGRLGAHADLFAKRCNQIRAGTFSTKGMIDCTSWD